MNSSADDEADLPEPRPNEEATQFERSDHTESSFHTAQDFELTEQPTSVGPQGLLGEYLLLEQIGAGGMGTVYRAEHRTMNRQVALKVLSDRISGRGDILEQFFQEIRAIAQLMHPNIVTAFDAGSAGATHYLVMELVEGEVLSQRIRRQGPLSSAEAVNVLEQAAAALDYAHRLGVIHRDIKPSNMMLASDGTLKVLDFGLAMISKGISLKTNKNLFMGTPEYMSPEQVENADSVDARSDLYSLGATLHYLVTGKPMFGGDKMLVATAQLRQKPKPLYRSRSDIDLRLDHTFQRLVAKQPSERFATAAELQEALQELDLGARPAQTNPFSKGLARLIEDNPTSVAFSRSRLERQSRVVAIDLGMLVSTAAFYERNVGPQIIQQGEGNAQHLRNMLWSRGDEVRIGPEAVAARQTDPEHVFHSVQRWIGAQQVNWQFAGQTPPPEVAIAGVLRKIMWNSSAATDSGTSAIVTVPACYDQLHRRAIRTACRIAGIELVQLLDKSLAAALCWQDLNARLAASQDGKRETTNLLVVHLGGSGMEASVIQSKGNVLRQLATHGSWKLGSLRWQHLLGEFFAGVLKEQTGKSIREDVASATRLQRTIEMALERLTRTTKVQVRFEWEGASVAQVVTQEGLLRIAPALVDAIGVAINAAASAAQLANHDIHEVLLTGSMMRMKPVEGIVRRAVPHVGRMTLLEKADLARGAAIQANYLSDFAHDNASPHAVGCTAYDLAILSTSGRVLRPKVLIGRGSELPTASLRALRPVVNSSETGKATTGKFPPLQVIEGTNLGGSNWLKLGKVEPESLFPQRAPDDLLQLKLEIDESGLLQSSLIWPCGNRQIHLPETSDASLSEADIDHWGRWLNEVLEQALAN